MKHIGALTEKQLNKRIVINIIIVVVLALILFLPQVILSKDNIYKKIVACAETSEQYLFDTGEYNSDIGTKEMLWKKFDNYVNPFIEQAKENSDIVVVVINDFSVSTRKVENKGNYILVNDPEFYQYNIGIYYSQNVSMFNFSLPPTTVIHKAYEIKDISLIVSFVLEGVVIAVCAINITRLIKEIKKRK